MKTLFTPGPWSTAADPIDDQDYQVIVVLPGKRGSYGTDIARCDHNWSDAAFDERRISWKEAEANARLIASAPELLEALAWIADNYENVNLNHVDFRVEAKHRADAAIAKALGK